MESQDAQNAGVCHFELLGAAPTRGGSWLDFHHRYRKFIPDFWASMNKRRETSALLHPYILGINERRRPNRLAHERYLRKSKVFGPANAALHQRAESCSVATSDNLCDRAITLFLINTCAHCLLPRMGNLQILHVNFTIAFYADVQVLTVFSTGLDIRRWMWFGFWAWGRSAHWC